MYKIVYAEEMYLRVAVEKVENEVNSLKNSGWTEQGGVSVSRPEAGIFYSVAQAMVKKEK